MLHCKYHHCFVINIIIISFVTPHCKYYHHSIVHVIHHFIVNIAFAHCKHHHLLTVCSFIVKSLDHIFALNFCHYSLSYSHFMSLPGLRVFNHTLPDWCVRVSYSCYLFLPFFVGWCPLALVPGDGAALHLSSPLGFYLGFLLVGELQLDQMSFYPLPSLPRNPLVKLWQESSPGCSSEWCSASIFCDQLSVSHTAPHLKVLYNQAKICKQTCRSTYASQMPVGLASVNNPKFRYLQESWFLVVRMPHLTGAGWSGLFGMLLLADGTGVGEVVFSTLSSDPSASSCPMLELMGSK